MLDCLGEKIIGLARDRDLLRHVGLLNAGRIQRQHLHVDAAGIHLRNALVSDLLKPLMDLGAARPRIAEPLGELFAWTGQKTRADEMLFQG